MLPFLFASSHARYSDFIVIRSVLAFVFQEQQIYLRPANLAGARILKRQFSDDSQTIDGAEPFEPVVGEGIEGLEGDLAETLQGVGGGGAAVLLGGERERSKAPHLGHILRLIHNLVIHGLIPVRAVPGGTDCIARFHNRCRTRTHKPCPTGGRIGSTHQP